ncbi:hypothetical protein KTS45_12655 [Halomicroarcula limicola]|uniref:DUF7344 domain-containing protein n=1 Tax=Haloarcula limicola TaxID=1429915 RepID=A0A8J8C7I0_9EURY|nr:hypothetical protein [Halomicroarcula limicola]MBV0925048.1 hypothetical protein [Halomicroarcula limicola]
MSSQSCYPDKAPRVSQLLDVLSDSIRREIVHFFENYADSRTVSFDELVSHIESRMPEKGKEELAVGLVHTHLPKLDHAGWLDHDYRTDEIRYHGHENAEEWLRDLCDVFSDRPGRGSGGAVQ